MVNDIQPDDTIMKGEMVVSYEIKVPAEFLNKMQVCDYRDIKRKLTDALVRLMHEQNDLWNQATQEAVQKILPNSKFEGKLLFSPLESQSG